MRIPVFQGEATASFITERDALAADLANNATSFVLALGDLGWQSRRFRGVRYVASLAFMCAAEQSYETR